MLGVGDPACDLSIAWTTFCSHSRGIFQETLKLDSGTWLRGAAWALWKALIVASGMSQTSPAETAAALDVADKIITDQTLVKIINNQFAN